MKPSSSSSCKNGCIVEFRNSTILTCGCLDMEKFTIQYYITHNKLPMQKAPSAKEYGIKKLTALNTSLGCIGAVLMLFGIFLDKNVQKDLVSKKHSFGMHSLVYIQVSHVFISALCKYDQFIPRTLRIFIYIVRLYGMEVFCMLFTQNGESHSGLKMFLISMTTIFAISIPTKLAYNLLMNNDIFINNQGNIKFKKGNKIKRKTYGMPLALVLLGILFGLYLTIIILMMHQSKTKIVPFDDGVSSLYWKCFLIDFLFFQIIKVTPELILIASVHLRQKPKAMRDTVIFITERYLLRYYFIFYLNDVKGESS